MPSRNQDTGRAGLRPLDQSELKKFPGYLLARARWVAFKTFEQALRDFCNLRPVEFSVLLLVATNTDVTQTQLSQALGVAPPNMTGLLRRLLERGLVERARAEADARQQFLTVTDEGMRLVTSAHAQILAADTVWLSRLTAAEQAMLVELLEKVTNA